MAQLDAQSPLSLSDQTLQSDRCAMVKDIGDIVYGNVSPRPAGDISFSMFHLVSIYLNHTTCFVMVLSTIFCGLKTGNLDQ